MTRKNTPLAGRALVHLEAFPQYRDWVDEIYDSHGLDQFPHFDQECRAVTEMLTRRFRLIESGGSLLKGSGLAYQQAANYLAKANSDFRRELAVLMKIVRLSLRK